MRTLPSLSVLVALGVMAVAPPAMAAPAKIKPGAVSASGLAPVKITNPNRYSLKGSIRLVSGKTKLASSRVAVKPRKSKTYRLRLSSAALATLRANGSMRVTVSARLGRPGRRARRYVKGTTAEVRSPHGPQRRGGNGVAGNRWKGTTSTGAEFPLTVDGGNVNLTEQVLQPVSCSEIGGAYRVALSSEPFDLLGPWPLGNQDGTQTKQVPRVNTLVTSGARTVTYRLKTSRSGNQISGSLIQTFSDSRFDIFSNTITFINCAGTLDFTAVPAS